MWPDWFGLDPGVRLAAVGGRPVEIQMAIFTLYVSVWNTICWHQRDFDFMWYFFNHTEIYLGLQMLCSLFTPWKYCFPYYRWLFSYFAGPLSHWNSNKCLWRWWSVVLYYCSEKLRRKLGNVFAKYELFCIKSINLQCVNCCCNFYSWHLFQIVVMHLF